MNNNYYGYPYQSYNYPNMLRSYPAAGIGSSVMPRSSGGLLRSLFGGGTAGSAARGAGAVAGAARSFTWGGFLNGASKTLGVINQAIPVFYQAKPIWNNARTMLRVARAVRSDDSSSSNKANIKETNSNSTESNDNEPKFFV